MIRCFYHKAETVSFLSVDVKEVLALLWFGRLHSCQKFTVEQALRTREKSKVMAVLFEVFSFFNFGPR
jgi:hypothetical protein